MAHFAKLDESNNVTEVVVVNNSDAPDEAAGVAFLTALFGGGQWVQTSYNATIRKQYAGIGYSYDLVADVFIAPRPFPSWALDANHDWQPPTPRPEGMVMWDDATLAWVVV